MFELKAAKPLTPKPLVKNRGPSEASSGKNRLQSTDHPLSALRNVKKKIFIKSRQESSQWQSTRTSSSDPQQSLLMPTTQPSEPVSLLSSFLNEEEDHSDSDFVLNPPDRYSQPNLFIQVKFFIGGKSASSYIDLDLSKKHNIRDVIKYLLTCVRKKKELRERVGFTHPLDEPDAFDLRHVDDETDSDAS